MFSRACVIAVGGPGLLTAASPDGTAGSAPPASFSARWAAARLLTRPVSVAGRTCQRRRLRETRGSPAGGAWPGPGPAPAPTHPLPARSPGELVRAWVVPGPEVAVLSTGTALGTLGSGFWALELRPQLSARAAARPAPRPGALPALSSGAPLRGTRRSPRRYPAEWRRRPRQSFASPRRRGSACAPPVPAASQSLLLQAARVCVSLSC